MRQLRASTNEAQTLPLTSNDSQILGARPRPYSAAVLWTAQRHHHRGGRRSFVLRAGPGRSGGRSAWRAVAKAGAKSPGEGFRKLREARRLRHADDQPTDRPPAGGAKGEEEGAGAAGQPAEARRLHARLYDHAEEA